MNNDNLYFKPEPYETTSAISLCPAVRRFVAMGADSGQLVLGRRGELLKVSYRADTIDFLVAVRMMEDLNAI